MDIEAIVTKYAPIWDTGPERRRLRAALTELAAGYEKKIAGLESEAILSRALSERIRQLEAELAESRERIRQLEVERVPEGFLSDVITAAGLVRHGKRDKGLSERLSIAAMSMLTAAPRRCHLCNYQHGHKIGCVSNPVDIALRAAAPAKEQK